MPPLPCACASWSKVFFFSPCFSSDWKPFFFYRPPRLFHLSTFLKASSLCGHRHRHCAPFVSMTRSGTTGFTLLHGVRIAEDLYYESIFRAAAKRYVPPCLSGALSKSAASLQAFYGRVTNYLERYLYPGMYDFLSMRTIRGDPGRDPVSR
jgi:hypothetical protein